MSFDDLLQKYLNGKTNQQEERELLDICLKEINQLLTYAKELKQRIGGE